MFRNLLAAMAIIALLTTNAQAQDDDLGAQIKAKTQTKIAQRFKVKETRTIDNRVRIKGDGNVVSVSADNSQNVTVNYREGDVHYTDARRWTDSQNVSTSTTTTDSRQWNLREGDQTYAPRTSYREGDRTLITPREYCPPEQVIVPRTVYAPAPRLTYAAVKADDCEVTICVCVSQCGQSFTTVYGGRTLTFKVLASYSALPYNVRGHQINMRGRMWAGHDGLLRFESSCPDGFTRIFIDP